MRPAPSGRQPYRSRRGNGYAPAGAPKGFPRGKQSARPALPRFADGLPELLRPIKKAECRFIRTALHPCQRSPYSFTCST